jgi:hypothetical protein
MRGGPLQVIHGFVGIHPTTNCSERPTQAKGVHVTVVQYIKGAVDDSLPFLRLPELNIFSWR